MWCMKIYLFDSFRFREDGMEISHLQYVDDTLCIDKPSIKNLWTLKALLRGFEMASCLKVNFLKSCLIGLNVEREFMDMACDFLNCSEGSLPFKYLGLLVDANPGREATWQPLVDLLTRRRNNWGNKFISLGGGLFFLIRCWMSFLYFTCLFWRCPPRCGVGL